MAPLPQVAVSLRLVLVRHGLSSFNLEDRIQGRDDLSSLTDTGREQARSCGLNLQEVFFTTALSSPLSRARHTAEELLAAQGHGVSHDLDDDLLEIDLEPWRGWTLSELVQRAPELEAIWRHRPADLELERADGQRYRPLPELMDQAGRFVDRLIGQHGDALNAPGVTDSVLVVGHNAILRVLVLQLLGMGLEGFRRIRLDNASISVLNLSRRADGSLEVQIESLNGTSHLDAPLPRRTAGPRLLLVRHGETDWNRQGRFQGQIDIPLNSRGLEQAQAAAEFLAPIPIQRAYTSTMARPRQTAEAILACHPHVPLVSSQGLREIGHGHWEGRLESEIASHWPELLADWKRAPQTVQMPEGENLQQVWDRSLDAWQRIVRSLDNDETALVVAHDAVNKALICHLLGLEARHFWAVKQGNGGVTVIDYPNGAESPAVVTSMNLTRHLGGVLDRTAAGAL
jgi:phosphoserine phosphatase